MPDGWLLEIPMGTLPPTRSAPGMDRIRPDRRDRVDPVFGLRPPWVSLWQLRFDHLSVYSFGIRTNFQRVSNSPPAPGARPPTGDSQPTDEGHSPGEVSQAARLPPSGLATGDGPPPTLASAQGASVTEDAGPLPEVIERSGARIGRYVVLSTLGAGGMGAVYEAFDPALERKVAIKVLRTAASASKHDPTHDPGAQRLMAEARALASLSHPNIVPIYDVGQADHEVYLAMELVSGLTLRAWSAHSRRPWMEVVETLAAAGDGLAAAHADGLMHRDFKPDNVMIGDDGRVIVLDFGLALASADPEFERASRHGPAQDSADGEFPPLGRGLTGTPAYMAPEQLAGHSLDEGCDQFSFFVALFEAVTGQRPFAGIAHEQLRSAMKSRGPIWPRSTRAHPRWLRRVIERGLAFAPESRHPSMACALEQLRDGLARTRRHERRRRTLLLAASLCIAGWAGFESFDQRDPCPSRDARWQTIWGAPAQSRMHEIFVASDPELAGESWARVRPRFDDFRDQWLSTYQDNCRAARVDKSLAELDMDLGVQCLDEAAEHVHALIKAINSGRGGTLRDWAVASLELPRLTDCRDFEQLRTRVPPPSTPQMRQRVDEVRKRLTEATALGQSGQLEASLAAAEELSEELRTLDYAPVRADVHNLLGGQLRVAGRASESVEHARAALNLARESHHWSAAAEAAGQLVFLQVYLLSQHELQHGLLRQLEATIEAAGGSPRLRAMYHERVGIAAMARGRPSDSIEAYLRALGYYTSIAGSNAPASASISMNIATNLMNLHQFDRARKYYERSLAILLELFGELDRSVAILHANLAELYERTGDLKPEAFHGAKAVAIATAIFGPDSPGTVPGRRGWITATYALGEYQKAEALALDYHDLQNEIGFKGHPSTVWAELMLAQVAQARGEFDNAMDWQQAFAHRISTQRQRVYSPDDCLRHARIYGQLGEVELARRALQACHDLFYARGASSLATTDLHHVSTQLELAAGGSEHTLERMQALHAIAATQVTAPHPALLHYTQTLARAHWAIGDFLGAEKHLEAALDQAAELFGFDHHLLVDDLRLLAEVQGASGRPDAAYDTASRARRQCDPVEVGAQACSQLDELVERWAGRSSLSAP